jgi:hypothetical protein
MAARGPPGEVARPPLTMEDEDALCLEVGDSGPDSPPEVRGDEGRGEA